MAKFDFNPKTYEKKLQPLIRELAAGKTYDKALRRYPKTKTSLFTKAEVIAGLRYFGYPADLVAKPIRTLSGVVPVTVLTKPYPCPGHCLYCPNDPTMPKSYLPNEPGGQRAVANKFDPYRQVSSRLKTYRANNHPTDKVELIVLGGTWSAYPKTYQTWFVKRCFEAFNGRVSGSLQAAQKINETAKTRCIGLSLETRPDYITPAELIRFRKLGCTKVQIGIQSLNNRILRLNRRGHTVTATKKAIKLLRLFGFKIQAHWMANLYGATPKTDITDFKKLFSDKNFRPDELKIYPCALIETSPLFKYYLKKLWQPYSQAELTDFLVKILPLVPQYCRVSRMIRDFSSEDIVAGNKQSNLRQTVEAKAGQKIKEIRYREIRRGQVNLKNLQLKILNYQTSIGKEKFLQWVADNNQICAFLRLSLPAQAGLPDKKSTAMIRELHVYGQSLAIGAQGKSQHLGLGSSLLKKAIKLAAGYRQLSVISAVGTREYYRRRGFTDDLLYQHINLLQ